MNAEGFRNDGAVHGGLFLVALAITSIGMPGSSWPWYNLLPLLIYGGVVLAVPSLRRTAPKLTLGRIGGVPLMFAAMLAAATVAILSEFHSLAHPEVTELAERIPARALGNLVWAGVCFSVVNAALEELIFRFVLWEAVASEWNSNVALIVTAAVFGLVHLHGYPPGPLGAVLAGLYGVALGLLRLWAGGLGLAVACHVIADATIFSLLASSGAFGGMME